MLDACPSCSALIEADASFCSSCAAPVTRDCPSCGRSSIRADAKFCKYCAFDLTEKTIFVPDEKPATVVSTQARLPAPQTSSEVNLLPTNRHEAILDRDEAALRTAKSPINASDSRPFGRKAYFLWILLIGVLSSILSQGKAEELSALVALAVLIPVVLRLRDIGASGWWCLLALVPVVNFALSYFLICAPTGYSKHGQPDTTMKILSAIFLSILFLFGVGLVWVAAMMGGVAGLGLPELIVIFTVLMVPIVGAFIIAWIVRRKRGVYVKETR
jgi:hypothetical protein